MSHLGYDELVLSVFSAFTNYIASNKYFDGCLQKCHFVFISYLLYELTITLQYIVLFYCCYMSNYLRSPWSKQPPHKINWAQPVLSNFQLSSLIYSRPRFRKKSPIRFAQKSNEITVCRDIVNRFICFLLQVE